MEQPKEIMIGIDEIMDVLDALEAVSSLLGKVSRDKTIDMNDVPVFLVELSSKMDIYKKAFEGSSQMLKEIKDVDIEETKILIEKIFSILVAFQKGKAGVV